MAGRKKKAHPRPPRETLAVGDARVVHGVGIARIAERVGPKDSRNPSGLDAWILQLIDGNGAVTRTILLPDGAKVPHRPLAAADVAVAMLEELRAPRAAPPKEAWDRRYERFRKVLIDGDPIAGAAALRELYAIPEQNFGKLRLTDAFEQIVLVEIALVLGQTFSALREELHGRWLAPAS